VMLGRVNGNLAVSRALGDFVYKDVPTLKPEEQKVSPEPDMTTLERSEKDEFLLLACDGVWDVMSNDAVLTFVTNQLKAGYNPTETCNRLLDYCLALDSKDNMSAVLVTFPGAPTKVEGFEAPENVPDPAADQQQQQQQQQQEGGGELDVQSLLQAFVRMSSQEVQYTEESVEAVDDDDDDDTEDGDDEENNNNGDDNEADSDNSGEAKSEDAGDNADGNDTADGDEEKQSEPASSAQEETDKEESR